METIEAERQKILKAGQLHYTHWLIVILSLVLTFSAWYFSKSQLDGKMQALFNKEFETTTALVFERLSNYEDRLLAEGSSKTVFASIMKGALSKDSRLVSFRISDAETIVYNEQLLSNADFDAEQLFSDSKTLYLYGRDWVFELSSTKSFRTLHNSAQPTVILIAGLLIDTLLLLVFILFSRSNKRAITFADKMSAMYKSKTEELEQTNDKLEKFAYIASHDLKTPLRGIGNLAEFAERDLLK